MCEGAGTDLHVSFAALTTRILGDPERIEPKVRRTTPNTS